MFLNCFLGKSFIRFTSDSTYLQRLYSAAWKLRIFHAVREDPHHNSLLLKGMRHLLR